METTASEPPALPAVERPRTLDPSVVRLWRVSGAIWTAILTLAAVALYVFLGDEAPVWVRVVPATLVLAYGIFYVAVWVPKAYRAWEFEIRDADVRLRHGVLWRRTSVVPHARIQHVDTRHGPLTRAFGLASVVLYTAGHTGASTEIPGLPAAEAESLRERLGALSGADDAV